VSGRLPCRRRDYLGSAVARLAALRLASAAEPAARRRRRPAGQVERRHRTVGISRVLCQSSPAGGLGHGAAEAPDAVAEAPDAVAEVPDAVAEVADVVAAVALNTTPP